MQSVLFSYLEYKTKVSQAHFNTGSSMDPHSMAFLNIGNLVSPTHPPTSTFFSSDLTLPTPPYTPRPSSPLTSHVAMETADCDFQGLNPCPLPSVQVWGPTCRRSRDRKIESNVGRRGVGSPIRAVKTAQTFSIGRHQWTRQIQQTSCPARALSPPSARRRLRRWYWTGVAGLARQGRANFAGTATRMEPEAAGELPRTRRFQSRAPGPCAPALKRNRHLQCHAFRRHPSGWAGPRQSQAGECEVMRC